jgi:hypothetical protein
MKISMIGKFCLLYPYRFKIWTASPAWTRASLRIKDTRLALTTCLLANFRIALGIAWLFSNNILTAQADLGKLQLIKNFADWHVLVKENLR